MNIALKKKLTAPLAAIGAAIALTAAIPAVAQARPYESQISYRHGADFDFRGLKDRIWQGVRTGDLTRFEARRLSGQVDSLENRADDYARGGLSGWERRDLRSRYQNLSERIYVQRHDNDYRGRNWR